MTMDQLGFLYLLLALWICLVWARFAVMGHVWANKHPWALSDWVIGSDLRARVLFRVFQVPRFFNFCFLISLKLRLFYKMLWHQASVFSPSVINDHSDDSGLGLLLLNLRESFAKSPNPWKNGHVYTCPVYVYIHCMAVKNWASIQWSRR